MRPNSCASSLATVLFPAPAGPSMVTTSAWVPGSLRAWVWRVVSLEVLEGITFGFGAGENTAKCRSTRTSQELAQQAPVAIEPRDGAQQLDTVADEDVVPQVRVAFGNPRHVEKTAWSDGEAVTRGRPGDAVRYEMRQVAGRGQELVVARRAHHDHAANQGLPETL